jgi:hypothetical protein
MEYPRTTTNSQTAHTGTTFQSTVGGLRGEGSAGSEGLRGVRPVLIPLVLEYLRFLIKVAQTA